MRGEKPISQSNQMHVHLNRNLLVCQQCNYQFWVLARYTMFKATTRLSEILRSYVKHNNQLRLIFNHLVIYVH